MTKLSLALGAIGLAMLLASALPAPAAPAAQALAPTIAPPTSAPTADPQADAAYGRALFLAKGCDRCHHHAAIAQSGDFGGMWEAPDLSTYRWDADYLRRWLKDPPAVKPGTNMPNLGLAPDEIDALIAFLKTGTK